MLGVLPGARYSPNNNNNMVAVMKKLKMGMGRKEEGSEIPGGWLRV